MFSLDESTCRSDEKGKKCPRLLCFAMLCARPLLYGGLGERHEEPFSLCFMGRRVDGRFSRVA